LKARAASGKTLPTDKYYLRPEEILSDANKVPDDWQEGLLREQLLKQLFLCPKQRSRSPRGRRHPNPLPRDRRPRAKSGPCVRCVGGVI
jgi:hypothetical protein